MRNQFSFRFDCERQFLELNWFRLVYTDKLMDGIKGLITHDEAACGGQA